MPRLNVLPGDAGYGGHKRRPPVRETRLPDDLASLADRDEDEGMERVQEYAMDLLGIMLEWHDAEGSKADNFLIDAMEILDEVRKVTKADD